MSRNQNNVPEMDYYELRRRHEEYKARSSAPVRPRIEPKAETPAEDIENVLKAQNSKYTIGTQKGTTGYMYSAGNEDFEYKGFKNLTTKGYTTGALAMLDLINGKIDAVILDMQPSVMIAASMNK